MTRSTMVSLGVVFALTGIASAAATGQAESSAMPLPLRVVGTRILNSEDEPVTLRGVNCASLEWTSDGQRHIVQSVKTAIDDWHVNHIRLPLSQDRWFGKAPEQSGEGKAYRARVREIVNLCASKGVYIILDLHWSDVGEWGQNIGQHSMPDENSLVFWKDLAPVYANHPAVIYDLYNEPHDVTWDIWLHGGTVTDKPGGWRPAAGKTFQAVGMQTLLDAVRAAGAKNIVIAGGLNWAYDFDGILDGRQLKDPNGNGVIYTNHAYNNKGHGVDVWIARMEEATAKFPVIVSEFGGSGGPNRRVRRFGPTPPPDLSGDDWLLHVMQALQDHNWSWTAWDFHPQAGPTLIADWNYTPTPDFGVFVQQMLAGTLPRYTPPGARTPVKFYLGADISSLAGGRGFGGRGGRAFTYQENGQEGTEFAIMMKHGWNAFRLRVFVSPVRMAPGNSLENTIPLAKQIKDAGATFMLDIHYSDTWADPQHQETPVAWRDLDRAGLEKRVEEYSKDVITQLRDAGAMPDMVQVGNEITGGMLWPTGYVKVPPSEVKLDAGRIRGPFPEPYDEAVQWDNLIALIKAGVRGVRSGAAEEPVQIIMHIDCGGDWPVTKWWFDHLIEAGVDYDIIGQSFYPRWHGTLELLQQNLLETARCYKKPVMVVETGYAQSGGEQIMSGNKYNQWPGTQEGQLQFMVDLVNTLRQVGGTGCFYWAPEGSRGNGMWNPDGTPAPSISVLDNLEKLKNSEASRLPPAPTP